MRFLEHACKASHWSFLGFACRNYKDGSVHGDNVGSKGAKNVGNIQCKNRQGRRAEWNQGILAEATNAMSSVHKNQVGACSHSLEMILVNIYYAELGDGSIIKPMAVMRTES